MKKSWIILGGDVIMDMSTGIIERLREDNACLCVALGFPESHLTDLALTAYEVLEVWGIMLEYIITGAILLNYYCTAVSKGSPLIIFSYPCF